MYSPFLWQHEVRESPAPGCMPGPTISEEIGVLAIRPAHYDQRYRLRGCGCAAAGASRGDGRPSRLTFLGLNDIIAII
jgi:hypothetical protein